MSDAAFGRMNHCVEHLLEWQCKHGVRFDLVTRNDSIAVKSGPRHEDNTITHGSADEEPIYPPSRNCAMYTRRRDVVHVKRASINTSVAAR